MLRDTTYAIRETDPECSLDILTVWKQSDAHCLRVCSSLQIYVVLFFCVFKEENVGKPNRKRRVFLLLRKHFNKMKCCQHLKLSVIQTPTTKDALHRFSSALFYFSVNKNRVKYLWTTIKTRSHTLTAWLQTLHKGHTINHPSSLVTQTHICFISLWYKHTLVMINPTTFQVLSTFPSLQ